MLQRRRETWNLHGMRFQHVVRHKSTGDPMYVQAHTDTGGKKFKLKLGLSVYHVQSNLIVNDLPGHSDDQKVRNQRDLGFNKHDSIISEIRIKTPHIVIPTEFCHISKISNFCVETLLGFWMNEICVAPKWLPGLRTGSNYVLDL